MDFSSLINTLRQQGIDPTAEELADALWFAIQIKPFVESDSIDSAPAHSTLDDPVVPKLKFFDRFWKILLAIRKFIIRIIVQNLKKFGNPSTSPTYSKTDEGASSSFNNKPSQDYQIGSRVSEKMGSDSAQPIRVPATVRLPGVLSLERALRPLYWKVASKGRYRLDVAATTQRIAEMGIWLPVLEGVLEPQFEISLVIDNSASMLVWQATVVEWQRLLQRHKAFRRIYTFFIQYQQKRSVNLSVGSRLCNPQELVDSSGRRLILVVSDCQSPAWYSGEITAWLELWGQSNPVAIVQMLPQRLWMNSGLSEAARVNLRAAMPGQANVKLVVDEWYEEDDNGSVAMKMPVVTLEPESLHFWVASLMGKSGSWISGVIFAPSGEQKQFFAEVEKEMQSQPPRQMTAEQRLQRFYAMASPTAQELAGHLAAVPLSLEVMRLVQMVMLPDSRQVHLAEVFSSGLIKRVAGQDYYDFHDGVRELLLKEEALMPESIKVFQAVSEYLERKLGHPLDFSALLMDPAATEQEGIDVSVRAFATIRAETLARRGGHYATLLKKIGYSQSPFWAQQGGRDEYGIWANFVYENVNQTMRWIEPGEFLMGSPEDEPERDNDETQHKVRITQGYWLADTACTQALWQAVMGDNPSLFKGQDNPVDTVSWNDIQNFLKKLNQQIPDLKARLPTEAQWEYACRAGTTTPFWFGNNITPEQVNYDGNYPYPGGKEGRYRGQTVPVKELPCNSWGLYQMHGNVWEWCQDWYSHYPQHSLDDPVTDPEGPRSGSYRVLRGGCWNDYAQYARSADRPGLEPVLRYDGGGFRFCLGIEEPEDELLQRLRRETPWATVIGRDEYGIWANFVYKNVKQTMRWIEPGEFLMGSPEDEPARRGDETQHKVRITQGYWLADTACTQALWQAVMGDNPSYFKGQNNPVERVSWNDIQNFLEKLNQQNPGLKARLPTEAQWEYACRAGTTTPFWFGNNITPEQVNYDGNFPYPGGKEGRYRKQTVPVKELPCNSWGLYQMHGNVWEWCQDWYSHYPQQSLDDPVTDPEGPGNGTSRVVRGGCWHYYAHYARSAFRYGFKPDLRYYNRGFRFCLG